MSIQRRFEFHDEVLALHKLLTETWAEHDPNSNVAKYPASYSETFLDMARAVTQAGYHQPDTASDLVVVPASLFSILARVIDEEHGRQPGWAHAVGQTRGLLHDQWERARTAPVTTASVEPFPASDTPLYRRISNQRAALRDLEKYTRYMEKANEDLRRQLAEAKAAAHRPMLKFRQGETVRYVGAAVHSRDLFDGSTGDVVSDSGGPWTRVMTVRGVHDFHTADLDVVPTAGG